MGTLALGACASAPSASEPTGAWFEVESPPGLWAVDLVPGFDASGVAPEPLLRSGRAELRRVLRAQITHVARGWHGGGGPTPPPPPEALHALIDRHVVRAHRVEPWVGPDGTEHPRLRLDLAPFVEDLAKLWPARSRPALERAFDLPR
jgi:hypothetical protein